MDDNSSLYLDAFNTIDKWLRSRVSNESRYDFPDLLEIAADEHPGVKRRLYALRDLNRFRNFVVHDFRRNQALAAPTVHAVRLITAIRDELVSPKPLLAFAATPVEHCQLTDPVGISVRKMTNRSFSQLPICASGKCLGLLTAGTVARWLSNDLQSGVGLVEEKTVGEILRFQEDPENHTFLGRKATADDGLTAFEDFHAKGKRLEAILITDRGQATESLLGIVTVHDIPSLRHVLSADV